MGETRDKSDIGLGTGHDLIQEIQPLIALYGVKPETLACAVEEALREIGENTDRSRLFGLILWKIFATGSPLWVASQTAAGNAVPQDLLVAAYAMWNDAEIFAKNHGADVTVAAEAMAQAAHGTADQLARNGSDADSEEIHDIRKYVFAVYTHHVLKIAGRQGSNYTDYVDMSSWIADREASDQGAFFDALENGILCRELLDSMPARGKSVAVARYILDYSWSETAGALDTSINAAQKALSSGVRKAFGICRRELQKIGYREVADIKNRMKNRNRFLRLK